MILPQRPLHVFELLFILCHSAALHTFKSLSGLFCIHELRGAYDWLVSLIDRDENVYNHSHLEIMANLAQLPPGHRWLWQLCY